jgi:Calcineurin-like phosphoesterase
VIGLATAIAVAAAAAGGQVEDPAVVWAVGDGADGSAVARRLARRIERDRTDAFLYLGDVYPGGTARDYARNYDPIYGRLAEITWPTAGNHEWWSRESGYYPYWRRHGRAKPWYRFSIGGWEVFSLNSEAPHGAGSRQLRWLRRALDDAEGTCRLAFWHRPRYSAGTVHGDSPDVEPFWRALRGNARLVVNGHEHALIRYRRRDGLTEYIAGAGGRVRYAVNRDRRIAFAHSDQTGALRMTLTPGAASLEFRSVGGEVLDRSRAACRSEPDAAARYRPGKGR